MRRHVILGLLGMALFLPAMWATELPTALATQASGELDHILQAAHISLPTFPATEPLWLNRPARSLVAAAAKARIAIAAHVIDTPHLRNAAETASAHAQRLQIQLMEKVQSHLSSQLDELRNLEEVADELHLGFGEGVTQTDSTRFIDKVLHPEKFEPLPEFKQGMDYKEKLNVILSRFKLLLRRINPATAILRWRVRRLLRKMSIPPPQPLVPSLGEGESIRNPTPWDMKQLTARLRSITALRSVQSESAKADAQDKHLASLIENAPVIHSDIVLEKEGEVKSPKKQNMVPIKLLGSDGTRAPRRWTHAFNRGPPTDWNNVPIPGMAR